MIGFEPTICSFAAVQKMAELSLGFISLLLIALVLVIDTVNMYFGSCQQILDLLILQLVTFCCNNLHYWLINAKAHV